jgi:hypothetical protein
MMSPQQMAAAAVQNEEINRLGLIERERQIRMFTQMMSGVGGGNPAINEDIYRFHLQQQQQQQQQQHHHQQKR